MATVQVTDATFEEEVKNSDIPVVVDFWAEWCGPCKMIGPALEELSVEYEGKIKIAKVNVDDNPNSPMTLGVRGIRDASALLISTRVLSVELMLAWALLPAARCAHDCREPEWL